MLSHFHPIPERNGQTDEQTDLLYQYRSRVSMLTRDKTWVTVRSRLVQMAPIDRPNMTYYLSAIVSIALFCTIFKLFDVA